MWFLTSLDITWYVEAVIHIRKKSSFLSFYIEWNRGGVTVKLTDCVQVVLGEKCHFASGILFQLLLLVILFHIEREWLLMRNLTTILPLKSKFPGKFHRFNAIDRSIEILKNNWIFKNFQLKWNIVKHFARRKKWAALRKLFSFPSTQPPSDKIFTTSLEEKFS